MAYPVTLNGRTYTLADFEGNNYVDGLPDAFEDFITHAGDVYNDTSTTSNSIGTGSKTFTVASGKPYQAGTPLRIADAAAPATNFLDAVVTSYSGTTLVVEAIGYGGSGTLTSWTVNIGGAKTIDGTLGVSQGGTGATTAAAARDNIGLGTSDSPTFAGLTVTGVTSFSDISISDVGDIAVDSVSGDADPDTKITFAGSNVLNIDAGGSTVQSVTTSGIGVTGNITVSGTVDGRDVSTDGTKLDGIEASADVTDTANVTAAGALMDSELTDIAAIKALDQGVATTDSPTFAELTTGAIDTTQTLPDVRPSLLLDFANSKELDPRITFSRTSTATYWDGKTTARAEQNLLTFSEDASAASVNHITLTTNTSDTYAPGGVSTADKAMATGSGDYHYLDYSQSTGAQTTVVSGRKYTASGYFKNVSGSSGWMYLEMYRAANYYAYFDIANGTIGSSNVNSAQIYDVGNGWYRCVITHTMPTSGHCGFNPSIAESNGDRVHNNTAYGFYVWGVQFEERDGVTSYTSTDSRPITRFQPALQTAASGEARFDHVPTSGESRGLLMEENRTNLIVCSVPEDTDTFGGNGWQDYYGFRAFRNQAISPDGTQNASLIRAIAGGGGTGNTMYVNNPIVPGSTADYTFSVFLKNGTENPANRVHVSMYNNGNAYNNYSTIFDLTDGTINNTNNGTARIEDVGNGWYRCIITLNYSAGTNLYPQVGSYGPASLGESFYMWGAQVELGSFATSHIPTAGSTVTRSVDNCRMLNGNFSDFLTENEYSVYGEFRRINADKANTYPMILAITDGGTDDALSIYLNGGYQFNIEPRAYASTWAVMLQHTTVQFGEYRFATAIKTDDFSASIDGGSVSTDTFGSMPHDVNQMWIGSRNGTFGFSGTIKKIAIYPKRLSDAILQSMSEE